MWVQLWKRKSNNWTFALVFCVLWNVLYTSSTFVSIAAIVYLFPVFIKANILFKPFIEFRNNRDETDFYSVSVSINLLKKWKNNSKSFVRLFSEKNFKLMLFKKLITKNWGFWPKCSLKRKASASSKRVYDAWISS